ncbi:Uncharacterized protein OBRU01_17636 [Operophtera brumata]|uniref:Uncharacterized protein n=1 Tax=Operophtera brumata TaxID=104452 RepID=A0A0L7L093_OPEBR|nr:Uncharacterized protein OBRU01_17636 [Operophtera brumata]
MPRIRDVHVSRSGQGGRFRRHPHETQLQTSHILVANVLRPLRVASLRPDPPGPELPRYQEPRSGLIAS